MSRPKGKWGWVQDGNILRYIQYPAPTLSELMHRAQAAQQAHAQKHDVQLAIVALVAQHPDKEAP